MPFLGPFLFALMSSMFAGLMNFFVKFLSRKLALGAVFLTIMVAMVAVFIAALNAIIATFAYAMPSFLSDGFGMFMPDNTLLCLTAIYSAQVARFVFDRNRDIVAGQTRLFS